MALGPKHNRTRLRRSSEGPSEIVSLVEDDPELAERIPEHERESARRVLLAPAQRIPRGRWNPVLAEESRPLAYLLLRGTVLRESSVGTQWSTEILGPGDLLRPWEEDDEIVGDTAWRVLEPVQAATLGLGFAARAACWPVVYDELLARAVRRTRTLATLRSIGSIRRLDERLVVLLQLLAGRWGKVSPLGVHVGLSLTHETLARLAGAQRPSVSASIARLRRDGVLSTNDRDFVLTAGPDLGERRTA